MTSKKLLVSLVAVLVVFALAVLNVSAATTPAPTPGITSLEVNGQEMIGSTRFLDVTAGDKIPVRVTFWAGENTKDVRVKAWIADDLVYTSGKFDVIANDTNTRVFVIEVPTNLKELSEDVELKVEVSSRNGGDIDMAVAPIRLLRENYVVDVLDANMPSEVSAGDNLAIDIVLKNQGRYFANNTFVKVSIPALGIENRAFFGDISSVDRPYSEDPFEIIDETWTGDDRIDMQDTAERKVSLSIPSNTPAGTYVVEITAYNGDSETTVTKKVVVTGSEARTDVIAPVSSRTVGTNEKGEYDLVLVNSGNKVQVFDLVVEAPSDVKVDVSDPVVVVPAGSSKTVKVQAQAEKAGTYNFAVNVHSGTELVKKQSFTVTADKSAGTSGSIVSGSPAVLLTVVLAVVFVVLLIVLIVLLTRRPEKTEETEGSYY